MDSRRRFLQTCAGSAVSLGCGAVLFGSGAGLAGCGSEGEGEVDAVEPTGPVAAGQLAATPVGTLRFVEGALVLLGRDAAGLFALRAICSHARASLREEGALEGAEVVCFRHGSRFDATGAVTRGPARSPLRQYRVTLDESGAITVLTDEQVPFGTRVPAG